MRTHMSTVFLSRSPSFCLLVIFSSAMISENIFTSFFFAFTALAAVIWGCRLVGWMSQTFGELIYTTVMTVLCLISSMLPHAVYHISNMHISEKDLNITSVLTGCIWLIAHLEYTNTKKVSGPFIQAFNTIIAFSGIFAVVLIFKLIFGYNIAPFENIQIIKNLSSKYWTSLSGSFILSGVLLFFLQKLEYHTVLDPQKNRSFL